MNNFFDRLGLRPQERRIVVGVGIVLFLVLNYMFVWPHFNDWKKVRKGLDDASRKLADYQAEIARRDEYQARAVKLEGQGETLAREEMALNLIRTVQGQASKSGVHPSGINEVRSGAAPTQASGLFDEKAVTMGFVNTGEEALIDFLFQIARGGSTIRVRDLNIVPDQNQTKLRGSMTLVASYQKQTQSRPAPQPASSPARTAPAAKAPDTRPAPATTSAPATSPPPARESVPTRQRR